MFVLQEAIRLINRERGDGGEESALIMEVRALYSRFVRVAANHSVAVAGTGIAAQCLIIHGIRTIMVKVDPLVYI